jgi:hypothetical protein
MLDLASGLEVPNTMPALHILCWFVLRARERHEGCIVSTSRSYTGRLGMVYGQWTRQSE